MASAEASPTPLPQTVNRPPAYPKPQPKKQSRKRAAPGSSAEDGPVSYHDLKFNKRLENHGSYMFKSRSGISAQSRAIIQNLLDQPQELPANEFFGDKFEQLCNLTQNRNEARVVQSLTPNLVPSAESYALHSEAPAHFVETWNESWTNSLLLPGLDKRPQPDYSVGFTEDAFSAEQHNKLKPWIGDALEKDQSPFMGMYMMYFPFLTCEVKCGSASLDVADRQNALSMTIATRGVARLFREVGREKELDGEAVGFSVSHDTRSVLIFAHYVESTERGILCWREEVRTFCFTELDGKERGTSYRFIQNLYQIWAPMHLKRIHSAIDQLPEVPSTRHESLKGYHRLAWLSLHHGLEKSDDTAQTFLCDRPSKKPRLQPRIGKAATCV